MSDHLDQLQQALSDAARREYGLVSATAGPAGGDGPGGRRRSMARRAWGRSLRRWPPFALVVLALGVGATAAAAIAVLVDRGSAPLSGTVPACARFTMTCP